MVNYIETLMASLLLYCYFAYYCYCFPVPTFVRLNVANLTCAERVVEVSRVYLVISHSGGPFRWVVDLKEYISFDAGPEMSSEWLS